MKHSFLTMTMADVVEYRKQQAKELRRRRTETVDQFKNRLKRQLAGKGKRNDNG